MNIVSTGDVSGTAKTETDVVDARRCTLMYDYKNEICTHKNVTEKKRGIGKTNERV